ncbi:type IV pilus twitching motility protein PilT [Alicyclobacillus fodiniaquatilis]|jgi:twitching motility protein PilT|uniref:Type IV pilus twitching motility protein PilT n=1 Tax=Alicyclobacillus fodiniaquatilis TaxID=1661150 RepID=A0ABW4JFB6_9BACL
MLIKELLASASRLKASDLHLGVGHAPMFRIHGRLVGEGGELSSTVLQEMTENLLQPEQAALLSQEGQIDFAYTDDVGGRYRINVFRQQGNIGMAIRVINQQIPSFEALGLPRALLKLIERPHGLILVTGPTGSGKSTTLAALIQTINLQQSKHIITLEDPIEYIHPHVQSIIHQREIGADTASFAIALRAALRQDPDVILVGELRDLETVKTAVTASETGHMVISTLHTSDAVQTVDRLIDMFPAEQQGQVRFQLAATLSAVISQRLLPTMDRQGRIAVAELLVNTPAVANLIRTQKTHQLKSVMQTSRHVGMQTFAMAVRNLVQEGVISDDIAKEWLDSPA